MSQVARTIAGALELNVDLVEALALAHDLGHPAFGHVGEAALNKEMQQYGWSFDHNFHALRIVEHFERRYVAFRGLNLTFEVREGLLKHSRNLDSNEPAYQEYFPNLQPTLEAQIIDGADAIAYLSADLEDAVEGGYLRMETACDRIPALNELVAGIEARYPDTGDRLVLTEMLRRLVGLLVDGLIEGILSAAGQAGVSDWEDVRRLPQRIAVPSESANETMDAIRSVLTETYYKAVPVQEVTQAHARKLSELFCYYVEHPEALPSSSVEQLGSELLPRLVCDYIAGMTDTYLLRCHAQVLGDGVLEQCRRAAV